MRALIGFGATSSTNTVFIIGELPGQDGIMPLQVVYSVYLITQKEKLWARVHELRPELPLAAIKHGGRKGAERYNWCEATSTLKFCRGRQLLEDDSDKLYGINTHVPHITVSDPRAEVDHNVENRAV